MADIPTPFLGAVVFLTISFYIHQTSQDEALRFWGAGCVHFFHCLPRLCCSDHMQYIFDNYLPKYGTVLRSYRPNRAKSRP